jgi:TatD DNase family protein
VSGLWDIGANLANKAFRADVSGVVARARAAGVEQIVVTGTSIAGSQTGSELARDHGLLCTAGVHPHGASSFGPDALDAIREMAARPEVVAVGECGLDFDRNFSPQDAQVRALEAQLELAAELGLPVFLHERAAHEAFVAILARVRPHLVRAVVHCFTGNGAELARYLELDCHIGITGWICDERRGTHLRDLVKTIPANRLMIETDAPYILPRDLPRAMRPPGGKNEPATLAHIASTVATCRGEDPRELARTTAETSRAFFQRL